MVNRRDWRQPLKYVHEFELALWNVSISNVLNNGSILEKLLRISMVFFNKFGKTLIEKFVRLLTLPALYTNNKRCDLYETYKPEDKDAKYIMLESLRNDRNSGRMIHTLVVSDDKYEFRLGRGHESDVRVNDISVSRSHLKITYMDGKFVMEDWGSKFGTLVLIEDELLFDNSQDTAIQVGRTMLNLSVKDNTGLFENPPFWDKSAAKFFNRKRNGNSPSFGKPKLSENIDDLPIIDRIQNLVPEFGSHSNRSIIRGNLLSPSEYRSNINRERDNR